MANIADLQASGVPFYASAAAENSKVVVAVQSILYGFDGRNTDTVNAIWVMVFDATALPANGTVPTIPPLGVPPAGSGATAANGNFSYLAPTWGIQFKNGIVIAASTTDGTLTVSAASKTLFNVQFAHEDASGSL